MRDQVSRKTYARDLDAVATTIEDLYNQIEQYQTESNRIQYRQTFQSLRDEGFDVTPDDELAEIPSDPIEAAWHVNRRSEEIRLHYRRNFTRPLAFAPSSRPKVKNETDMRRIVAYIGQHKCSFEEGCKSLGFSA